MRISPRQVEASYQIANRVFDHKITVELGANMLQDEHGLNINSARDFINDYRLMLQGKVFQRAMSAPAIDYYLSKILEGRGQSALEAAISAVEKHIKYYEGIRKVNLNAMRAVVARHKSQMTAPLLLGTQEASFRAAVRKAIADSPDRRQARLRRAARTPVKVKGCDRNLYTKCRRCCRGVASCVWRMRAMSSASAVQASEGRYALP